MNHCILCRVVLCEPLCSVHHCTLLAIGLCAPLHSVHHCLYSVHHCTLCTIVLCSPSTLCNFAILPNLRLCTIILLDPLYLVRKSTNCIVYFKYHCHICTIELCRVYLYRFSHKIQSKVIKKNSFPRHCNEDIITHSQLCGPPPFLSILNNG